MNKHTVFVAGKHFVLLSDDKSDYVEKIASEVNDTITKITTDNPALDRRAAAILCALDYADDLHKEKQRNSSLSEKAQPLIAQADKQAKQIKELREKLGEKDAKIEKLQKELGELRETLKKAEQKTNGNNMRRPEPAQKPQNHQHPQQPVQQKKPNNGYRPTRQYSLFDDEK